MFDFDLKEFVKKNKELLNILKRDFNAKYFHIINATFIVKIEKYFNFYTDSSAISELGKEFFLIEEHEIFQLYFFGFSEKRLKNKIKLPGINLNGLNETFNYIKERGWVMKSFYPDNLAVVYVTDDNNFNPFINIYKNFSINCRDKISEPDYKIRLFVEKSFVVPNLFLSLDKKRLINKKI